MTSGTSTSWLRSRRGRQVGIGLLAGALVAGGIAVAATVSSPAVAEAGSFKDLITIEPGTGFNAVSYYDSLGNRTSQPLAAVKGGCNLTDNGSGAAGILRLTGTFAGATGTDNVGLNPVSGSLGIAEKKSGTSCAQVEVLNSESMTLALPGGSPLGISANLDVEVQKDAVIRADVSRGATQVGTFYFYSGKSTPTRALAPNEDSCQGSATSSGSNSNITDNCRWEIKPSAKFDKIVMTSITSGQFSLEGGADGLLPDAPTASSGLPRRASFIQVESVLLCGQSTFTLPLSGTAPQVTVRRLDNADPTQTCKGFTYDLSNTNAQVTFVKPFDLQTSVQFVMELAWPITSGDAEKAELPPVKFSFHDTAGVLSGSTFTLDWCPNPVYTNGKVTGLNPNPLTNSAIPDMETGAGFPGKQFACVAPTTLQLDANNNPIGWSQPVYILGDAYARR